MKYSTIAFVGITNSGKSTLFNNLLQKYLSPVSAKRATTFENYYYTLKKNDLQLLLIDTPGYLYRRAQYLQQRGNSAFWISIEQADTIFIIANVTKDIFTENYQKFITTLRSEQKQKQCMLILNKIDLISKSTLILIVAKIAKIYPFIQEIIPISALYNRNIPELVNVLFSTAKWHHGVNEDLLETLQDISEKRQILLFLREAFLIYCHQEIPYALRFEYVHSEELTSYTRYYIRVFVHRENQIAKLVGKQGILIKKIINRCQSRIYQYNARHVKLKLLFKVKN